MAKGILLGPNKAYYWNIDAHVGTGCPNKPEDVELVQFGYYCMGQSKTAPLSPAMRKACQAVKPGSAYSGAPGDPLTIAIRAHQQARGGTQDGRVSPIQEGTGSYGPTSWMLVPLNTYLREMNINVWPALHKSQTCPGQLKQASTRAFARVDGT
ncbi:MAG: hypothetical protein KJZ84_01180 [Bryobacteraceae bacterium]|nr:hypothetical protein [Bryobacteraceae bacterium]